MSCLQVTKCFDGKLQAWQVNCKHHIIWLLLFVLFNASFIVNIGLWIIVLKHIMSLFQGVHFMLPERVYKVVFVGDSGVGKSSFIHRFCSNTFKATFSATIGKCCIEILYMYVWGWHSKIGPSGKCNQMKISETSWEILCGWCSIHMYVCAICQGPSGDLYSMPLGT